jgi:hypothetical protein
MLDHRRIRHAGALAIAAATLTLGCHASLIGPQVDDVYIEVHVTGGFAGVDYTFAIVGEAAELRGIACVRSCDFEPGEPLASLTRDQVVYYAELLDDAGIRLLDGTDFGEECCDQFHYDVEYRERGFEATVQGSSGSLPEDLSQAVGEIHRLWSSGSPIVIEFESSPEEWPRDPLVLHDYDLDGGVLSLDVEYGGGCETHEHALVAWGGWMESFPVQVNVLLTHEDHDDPCDALIRRTLRFDLGPLREEYYRSYPSSGPAPSTVLVQLTVPDGEGARQIEYTF